MKSKKESTPATATASAIERRQHSGVLQILGELGVVYFRATLDGQILEFSPAENNITGYTLEELNRGGGREMPYAIEGARGNVIKQAKKGEGAFVGVRATLRRKSGDTFIAEGDLRIVQSETGEEIVEGLYRDVSDRLRTQEFIGVDKDEVLQDFELYQQLQEFASFHLDYITSLAHQLTAPFVSLVGNLDNFKRGLISTDTIQDRLPYLIGQANTCVRLVKNISYMDKILRGVSFSKDSGISLARLAIETKLDLLPVFKKKQIRMHVDGESINRHLPSVGGHKDMLRQVVFNLTDNAIKYSFDRTTVMMRARHLPDGRVFEVCNQGLSIPLSERKRIFGRGYRTRKAAMLIPHGTGLGLWLARKIVEGHGAKIRCTEVVDDGASWTVFQVFFPDAVISDRRRP